MKTCIAIRHLAFEDLGITAPVIEKAGYQLRYIDAGVDTLDAATLVAADLLVILGGPIGVYEEKDYPFLTGELAAIAARVKANKPTLGFCLGGQLIAKALGAEVAPGPQKEIGWMPVDLSEAGKKSVLRHLEKFPVLHWHGDCFGLPNGAISLASTAPCPHQAFAIGNNILALQFHIEAEPAKIERWLIGHTGELAKVKIAPGVIRAQTKQHGTRMVEVGARIISEWLGQFT